MRPALCAACPCGLLAHAWARPESRPSARPGRAPCVPSCDRSVLCKRDLGCIPARTCPYIGPVVSELCYTSPPARHPAALPARLSLPSGAGGASCFPRRLIDFRLRSPVTRRPAIQPAPALPSAAAFPLCAPAKSGALGCSPGAANYTIALRFHLRFGVGTEYVFFPGSAETVPLVVLRKYAEIRPRARKLQNM
jgi:hypothetical protein